MREGGEKDEETEMGKERERWGLREERYMEKGEKEKQRERGTRLGVRKS